MRAFLRSLFGRDDLPVREDVLARLRKLGVW
jgi:hypothetical protein